MRNCIFINYNVEHSTMDAIPGYQCIKKILGTQALVYICIPSRYIRSNFTRNVHKQFFPKQKHNKQASKQRKAQIS